MKSESGITLVELIIVVAIVAILSAIAAPLYRDYIDTAKQGVMTDNMRTIQMLEEGLRLSGDTYQAGTYDPDNPGDANGLTAKIGWSPGTSVDEITYVVDMVSSNSFRITATHSDGTVVQKTYTR